MWITTVVFNCKTEMVTINYSIAKPGTYILIKTHLVGIVYRTTEILPSILPMECKQATYKVQ